MDYELKVARGIPSSQHYKQIRVWSARSNRSKIDSSLKKYTYLDLIETEQKKRKKPAPGDYRLSASDAEIKEMQKTFDQKSRKTQRHSSTKRYFYQDEEYLSNVTPGPGNYNPRPASSKMRENTKDRTFWVEKHKKQNQSMLERAKKDPDMGSYTPIPL